MRQLRDPVWQVRGTSWVWDEEARNQVCTASEIWSLRQFLRAQNNWPSDLPSNGGRTLVVAGLGGALDLLTPEDSETWLSDTIRSGILSFQEDWGSDGALVFWMPGGDKRLKRRAATDEVDWLCHAPNGQHVEFSRVLWGQAGEYTQEILLRDGSGPAGLFHLRIT